MHNDNETAVPVTARGRRAERMQNGDKPRRRRSSARPPRLRRNKDYWRQLRSRSGSPHPRPKKIEWTPAEREVIRAFLIEVAREMHVCVNMTDEELEDEYRRAGKLHEFDPVTEIEKRYARVANKYQLPDDFHPELQERVKLFADDD